MSEPQSLRLIKMPVMAKKIAQGPSAIYAKMDPESKSYDETFPLPVKVSARGVAWYEHEVDAWIQSRPRVDRGDFENQSDRVTE